MADDQNLPHDSADIPEPESPKTPEEPSAPSEPSEGESSQDVPQTEASESIAQSNEAQDEPVEWPEEAGTSEPSPYVDNVGRVLDVNLEVTVKIGELRMRLRDVLNIHPGSILEVEKAADDPLPLQIGNKTLAVGEVVTVGESIGIRIKK